MGRGATRNDLPARFGLAGREADGDWLDQQDREEGGPPKLKTSVQIERPKSILTRNSSPDVPFDRSVNPYRGCEHGCIYCYARPTHAFHDLSPGLDFESKLFAKPDAPGLLRRELAKKSYAPAAIAFGTNTDAGGFFTPIAEVIADGSIHVYAPLRGRALAGASGDANARILSTAMEAELVSIAGVYRTFDEGWQKELAGKPAQVRLKDDRLDIKSIPVK